MQRLIYVSKSNIEITEADAVVAQIVAEAQKRNARLNLTGALIFTGTHFAQVLEGSPEDIEEMMASLQRDSRHQMIAIVNQAPIMKRRFDDWKMAYQGRSDFMTRQLHRLLHATSGSEQRQAADWIIQLAHEFSVRQPQIAVI